MPPYTRAREKEREKERDRQRERERYRQREKENPKDMRRTSEEDPESPHRSHQHQTDTLRNPSSEESDGSQLSSTRHHAQKHISRTDRSSNQVHAPSLSESLEREPRRDAEGNTRRSTSAFERNPDSECCHSAADGTFCSDTSFRAPSNGEDERPANESPS